jgi:hypothetical protein
MKHKLFFKGLCGKKAKGTATYLAAIKNDAGYVEQVARNLLELESTGRDSVPISRIEWNDMTSIYLYALPNKLRARISKEIGGILTNLLTEELNNLVVGVNEIDSQ